MLKECLNAFNNILQDESLGEKFILDSYVPSNGTYIIVDTSKNPYQIKDKLEIKLNKKTKVIDGATNINYEKIRIYDYNSSLIDMNKPIDSSKVIHSNNYLSFFIKKENIEPNGKLNAEKIDNYYKVLSNPKLKYKDKKSKYLYESIEKDIGPVDNDFLEKNKNWIKENIYTIESEAGSKEYIKIFFEAPVKLYEQEGKRYFIPNIYNKNEYNQSIKDKIYGLPNNNMGMNAKKPYLENKSRKCVVPYLIDSNEVLLQKKFFDYLLNQASYGKINTYIDTNPNIENKMDTILSLKNGELPDKEFRGIYLRTLKGKELEIQDSDYISSYRPNFRKTLNYKNYLDIDTSKLKESSVPLYSKYKSRSDVQSILDEVFFNKFLKGNYFTPSGDIRLNDQIIKQNLLSCRTILFNWLYKGYENNIEDVLDKISMNLVKGSILNDYLFKAANQFNLRWSLKEFFKGDKNMADFLYEIQNKLRNKLNSDKTKKIDDDREYFFAIGQEVHYLLSLNKSSKKTQSLVNPFINAKSDVVIKEKLRNLYKKYNYVIEYKSKRSDNLYSMILGYEVEGKVNQDMIIAGFLSNSLIYEKKEEEK